MEGAGEGGGSGGGGGGGGAAAGHQEASGLSTCLLPFDPLPTSHPRPEFCMNENEAQKGLAVPPIWFLDALASPAFKLSVVSSESCFSKYSASTINTVNTVDAVNLVNTGNTFNTVMTVNIHAGHNSQYGFSFTSLTRFTSFYSTSSSRRLSIFDMILRDVVTAFH